MHREQLHGVSIFVIHDFLSPTECAEHVARAERLGFEEATLGGGSDPLIFKQVRDNDRVILDDPALASTLYERARPFLVEEWFGWRVCGFAQRWRYYRYEPGQRFALHGDGSHSEPTGEESQFTFMVYLNDDCEGGTTNFHLSGQVLRVKPATGLALVFMHKHLHEGAEVLRGKKYVLRTDVMYEPTNRRND